MLSYIIIMSAQSDNYYIQNFLPLVVVEAETIPSMFLRVMHFDINIGIRLFIWPLGNACAAIVAALGS